MPAIEKRDPTNLAPYSNAVDLLNALANPAITNSLDILIRPDVEGETEEVASLRNAHNLAVLAVYDSNESRQANWRDVTRGLVEACALPESEISAGIQMAIERGSLVIIQGGVLVHPSAIIKN